jgi:AsmA-like C-terminal region
LAGEKAKFELAQGEVILETGTIRLKNGIVRGANVGATAEGIVLSSTGQMDLRGTFMPARGLNRIVGAIPLLGLLLGSGSKAGLIGITYQLAGDAKNPKVFVNPISMIAPGVFRQVFE